jgi:hypothetical protein
MMNNNNSSTDDESSSQQQRQQEHDENINNNNNDHHEQGSGLASYFRDYYGDAKTKTNNNITYLTSLSELESLKEEDLVPVEKELFLTYKEYRSYRKKKLVDYLMKRLASPSLLPPQEDAEEEKEEDSSVTDEEEEDEDGIEQSQFETQPFLETQPSTFVASAEKENEQPSPPNKRQKLMKKKHKIPHITDTLHDVTKLEYVDLYTQNLSIPLCVIKKACPLRDTKRGQFHGGDDESLRKKCHVVTNDDGGDPLMLPRVVFDNMEDDGPISTTYKTVFSIEVEQLKIHHSNIMDQHHHNHDQKQHTIKIFFYDEYATKISDWLSKQKKKKNVNTGLIIMNLSNIPSKCIFPYPVGHHNWFHRHDHSMVQYCICIGGKSSVRMLMNHDDPQTEHISFDDTCDDNTTKATTNINNNLTIRIAEVGAKVQDELVLSHQQQQQRNTTSDFLSSSEEHTPSNDDHTNPQQISLQYLWTLYTDQQQITNNNNSQGQRRRVEPMIFASDVTRQQTLDASVSYVKLVGFTRYKTYIHTYCVMKK